MKWVLYIPLSFFSGGTVNGICFRCCPITSRFSRQSTWPSQPAGTCRDRLRLLVNVWSLFVIVVVGGSVKTEAPTEKAHSIIGTGFPVAEQLNTASVTPSCSVLWLCTFVFTSDIPGKTNRRHFLRAAATLSHEEVPHFQKSQNYWIYLALWRKSYYSIWVHQETHWRSKYNSCHLPMWCPSEL